MKPARETHFNNKGVNNSVTWGKQHIFWLQVWKKRGKK